MGIKILHTADWHLGKKLDHFSRIDEQRLVLNKICEIAEEENLDIVIVERKLLDSAIYESKEQEVCQEGIPRSIDVVKDEDTGSVIYENWN